MKLNIDPDLRQALEDVAKASPTNGIFAGLGSGQIRGAFALPDQEISVARAGLCTAERHVISVHRVELARILNQAFVTSHYALEGIGDRRFYDGEVLELGDLVARTEAAKRVTPPDAFRYRSGYFLSKIVSGEPISNLDEQASLTVASMRLHDTFQARTYYSTSYLERGGFQVAYEGLMNLMDAGHPLQAAYASGLWRQALEKQGRLREAMQMGERAARLAREVDLRDLGCDEAGLAVLRRIQARLGVDINHIESLHPEANAVIRHALSRIRLEGLDKIEAERVTKELTGLHVGGELSNEQ